MILGLDGDTEESIKETYKFVMDMQLPVPKFYILTPIPGTELFYEYKEKNKLLHEDFTKYNGTRCVHKMNSKEPSELTKMYKWIVTKVYSYSSIIIRYLLNRNLFKDPGLYLSAFAINLVYRKFVKNG